MKKEKTFAVYTLGCKLNFSETSAISRQLSEHGLSLSNTPDYIIVNSCAVTGTAEKKVRNLISKLHKAHESSEIIVIGCYSELQSELVKSWDGVSAVFGSINKIKVIDYILNSESKCNSDLQFSYSSNDRTRSFLKIQDGCDYHCTYCTVAMARGESRSDSIAHVLQNIEKIAGTGIKEVNLTGVNIGDFGHGTAETLYDLLRAIVQQNAVPRIRISSIEPNLLTDAIIELVAQSDIMMPHFHIPLQSGSNKILSSMKRRYKRELFAKKVHLIKEKMPEACIAVDVITGFPDETAHDFEDSYQFIKELPISYLHVFTYSKRPDTPAATMFNQVPETVKRERTDQLLTLSARKKEQFYQQNFCKTVSVLMEYGKYQDCMFGFSHNYVKVKLPYNEALCNCIIPLEITPENISLT
ncbi:MAG: tRNA (N(6)-L-threonylcarbamoyladenosine(37)-C(2))-methylthiotransferase MtaB [Bacteroidales bacterium]|jgi:threonylcarbamoyladenosine tRNA methylthiotransferase MtaB|nr:tRNA (N(6)-L-threonylcarbamoyladenosine(37)-C(2))-methylthiotransferase MtaB [Bacteroidales bacterium]